jgi:hypothetical protein
MGEVLVIVQHLRSPETLRAGRRSTLGPFAMWAVFPPSDYYGPSVPDQSYGATHLYEALVGFPRSLEISSSL